MGTSMSTGFFFRGFLLLDGPLLALNVGRVTSHDCRALAICQRSSRSFHLVHSREASVPFAHTSGTSRSNMSLLRTACSSVGCQSVHVPRALDTPSVTTTSMVIHLICTRPVMWTTTSPTHMSCSAPIMAIQRPGIRWCSRTWFSDRPHLVRRSRMLDTACTARSASSWASFATSLAAIASRSALSA
jgi:hypothetical protein